MNPLRPTLTTRFTLFYSSVALLFLGTFSFFVYQQSEKKSYSFAQHSLESLLEHEWEHIDLPSHKQLEGKGTPHFKDVYLRIIKSGVLLYDSFPTRFAHPDGNGTQNKIFHSVKKKHNDHEYELQGLYDLTSINASLTVLRNTLIACCLGSVLLIIPLALLFTRTLLSPFRSLADQTSKLSAERLTYRFEEPKSLDEYGMLTINFNLLLQRLEHSFSQVRRFAMNASHELRTPLSVIISQGEFALRKDRSNEEYRDVISKMLGPAKRLRGIINRLLFLADLERIEQEGGVSDVKVKPSIEGIVNTVQAAYHPLLKDVELKSGENDSYRGNREIFEVVIGNLVENAYKHANSTVQIECRKFPGSLKVTISDDGSGMSPEEMAILTNAEQIKIPDNFKTTGTGLGLSIVRTCLDSVRGKLQLSKSLLGGLNVCVELPSR